MVVLISRPLDPEGPPLLLAQCRQNLWSCIEHVKDIVSRQLDQCGHLTPEDKLCLCSSAQEGCIARVICMSQPGLRW